MPSAIKSNIQAGAAGEGWLKPDNYATGAHYTNPYDRRGFGECMAALLAGTVGASGTVDAKAQQAVLGEAVNDLDLTADTGLGLRLGATDNAELGVSFTTPNNDGFTPSTIQLRLKRAGTIAASKKVTVTLQADSSGKPDDTDLFTPVEGDLAPDGISSSEYVTVSFTVPDGVHLAANTLYWIVVEGDYAASSSNYLLVGIDTVASGGNVNIHEADWGSVVTTQKGHVAVAGYDWTDISGAAFTQVTASNDEAPQYGTLDLEKAAGTHLRGVMTVGTAACDAGLLFQLSGPATRPVTQTYAFAV